MVKSINKECLGISGTKKLYLDNSSVYTPKENKHTPFWNNNSKEISSVSWIPDKCGLVREKNHKHYPNTASRYMKISANTSTNKHDVNWCMSDKIKSDNYDEKELGIRSVVYRLKLSPVQKIMFTKFMAAHRYFYNKSIAEINKRYESKKKEFTDSITCVHCNDPKDSGSYTCLKHKNKALSWQLGINHISLRKSVLKADKNMTPDDPDLWQKEIPYDTRDLAIKDAVSAYNSAISNFKNGNIKSFHLGFKSRKNKTGIFWVKKDAAKIINKELYLFPTRLKDNSHINMKKRESDQLPVRINSAFKIYKNLHAWYAIITVENEITDNCRKNKTIALDPGQRTFLTGYSPNDNKTFFIGEDIANVIYRLHDILDKLQSKKDKLIPSKKHTKSEIRTLRKTRKSIKIRTDKLQFTIKHKIADLHNQVASWLSRTFDTIILPKFGTSKMQQGNTLQSSTKRKLQCLSHYKFQQKIKWLCSCNGSKLYLVDEDYTTKTCGKCGIINDVGSNKIFKCHNCDCQLNRDLNGARNIWIKTMTENGVKTRTPQSMRTSELNSDRKRSVKIDLIDF
jgi:IS605 OrfB family transposase